MTPFDFLDLGSRAAVDQGLSRLTRKQVVKRLDRGIYTYPKMSRLLGELSPDPETVARALARRDAAKLIPTGAAAANLLGLSEQVPNRVVYLTNGPARSAKVGQLVVALKPTVAKNMATANRASGVIIQALRFLGKDNVGDQVFEKLRERLSRKDREQLLKDAKYAPAWMQAVFRKVAEGVSE